MINVKDDMGTVMTKKSNQTNIKNYLCKYHPAHT